MVLLQAKAAKAEGAEGTAQQAQLPLQVQPVVNGDDGVGGALRQGAHGERSPPAAIGAITAGYSEQAPWDHNAKARDDDESRAKRQRVEQQNGVAAAPAEGSS